MVNDLPLGTKVPGLIPATSYMCYMQRRALYSNYLANV